MVDWNKLKQQALDVSKKTVDSVQDWKNDPERLKRVEENRERQVERAELRQIDEENNPEKYFKPTSKTNDIKIDENHKVFIINSERRNPRHIFDDLVSYELLQDDSVTTKGGASIGRAIVGGVLFNVPGAIIGGVTGSKKQVTKVKKIDLRITIRNSKQNTLYINIYKGSPIKTDSKQYQLLIKKAQETLSLLDIISSYQ